MSGHRKKRRAPPLLQRIDVEQKRLAAILERTRTVLNAEEHATLSSLVDTVAWVQAELQTKDASLERLRKMIFGASTESTRHVLGGRRPRNTNTAARAPRRRSIRASRA